MKIVNKNEFNALKENGNVVVDFFADWCGPCKMLSPVLEKISEEYKDVTFVKVNCDDEEELAAEYGIMSIPAVFFLKDGQIVNKFVGSKTESAIKELLDKTY